MTNFQSYVMVFGAMFVTWFFARENRKTQAERDREKLVSARIARMNRYDLLALASWLEEDNERMVAQVRRLLILVDELTEKAKQK